MTDISQRAAGMQHRSYTLAEHSFVDGPEGFTFEGVASTVDMPYTVRDQFGEFTETIAPGAFNKATREAKLIGRDDDVFLYVNHRSTDVPMARLSAGTLKLSADPHLRAVATLDPARPDVQIARSAVTRGELTDMSIGFTVNKGRDTWNDDWTERVIHEVNLREVSIVAIGANPFTSASMRSADEWLNSLTNIELSADQFHRAEKALWTRFADLFTDDVRKLLREALVERFNPGHNSWLYVYDFTDNTVIFELEGSFANPGLHQLAYSIANGKAVLDAAAPTPIAIKSTYVERASFAQRDREDMDRLLRTIAAAPVL